MSQLAINGHEITVPKPEGGLVIDMGAIAKVEARLHEVAFVTPQKAPELLSTYNAAWLEISKHVVMLKGIRFDFDKLRRQRKSILTLEVGPQKLKELGLVSSKNPGGNDDLRQAILDGDEQYSTLESQIHQVDCVIELFKYKATSFENAYTAVKKIMGEDAYGPMSYNDNPNLSGGLPENIQAGQTDNGFGNARY